jgi:predicted porin
VNAQLTTAWPRHFGPQRRLRSRIACRPVALTVLPVLFALSRLSSAAEVDVYGRLNLTLQNSDEAAGEKVELQNNASRIGVKGELELKGDLKAIYQLEFGVDLDDRVDEAFTDRNQFVGLGGAFGTVKVGRHDTALKQAQGDFDLFDDLEGDIVNVFNGENRLRNYVGYTSPTFAEALSATVNFFPGEDPEAGNDGVADGVSVSFVYGTELIYAAVAFDDSIDGEDIETARAVGGYTLGPARLMLMYQRTDAAGVNEEGFGGSLAWTFGDNTAKVQYLTADIWRLAPLLELTDPRHDMLLSAGLDHKFAETTRLFVFYTTGEIGGTRSSDHYTAIGIEHNF